MMRHPMHNAFEKIDKSIADGHMTKAELEKQAKKYPGCFADAYLKSRESK